MKEIEVRGTKTEEGNTIDVVLNEILSRKVTPKAVIKERGAFGKGIPFGYERWGVWSGAISESEVLKSLKLIDELSEVKRQVDDLDSKVEALKLELRQCKVGIGTIIEELREKPIIKQTELFEIDDTLELLRPIPIVIEEYSDEVIASFPEIEVFGVGSGEAEAIGNLKKEIVNIYFEIINLSEDKLGKVPMSWKRVLTKVVQNIGHNE